MSIFRAYLVAVSRTAAGTYTKGRFTAGTSSTFNIRASIQPASAEDVQTLPEGRRNSKVYAVYSDTQLYTVDGQAQPDLVTFFGETYEVMSRAVWQNQVIPHYRYVVAKVGEP